MDSLTHKAVRLTQCLIIGDSPAADVLGAHAVGMKTTWFRCGMPWPSELEPRPGPAIDALSEVLRLIDEPENLA